MAQNQPDHQRLEQALARFDHENAQDPNLEPSEGSLFPRELLYAKRLSHWVSTLAPDASETLRLAARAQHICRWTIPRTSYPSDKAGYLRWRNDLKKFHARKAAGILREIGYPDPAIRAVESLIRKENFPSDPESRVLEDALCLVFLQFQFRELAERTSEDKMINALRKSWNKMTPAARGKALELPHGPAELILLKKALEPAS